MKNVKKNYIISYPATGCTKDEGLMIVNAIRWFLNRYNMQLSEFDDEHEDITITANAGNTRTFSVTDNATSGIRVV